MNLKRQNENVINFTVNKKNISFQRRKDWQLLYGDLKTLCVCASTPMPRIARVYAGALPAGLDRWAGSPPAFLHSAIGSNSSHEELGGFWEAFLFCL